MNSLPRTIGMGLAAALAAGTIAHAQGRGSAPWSTPSGDAQRTAWIRTDAKISVESVPKDFKFLWKATLEPKPKGLVGLTQPVILPNIISYKGFKALAYMGGSGDNVYALDYDLNKIFWKVHLTTGATTGASATCPGGLTAVTRAASLAPPAGRGGGGGGRGAATPPGPTAFLNAFGGNVYAISSGGMVHALNAQTGEDLTAPAKLLPPNATVVGSAFVGDTLYAAVSGGCGGAANGVYALTYGESGPVVKTWDARGATVAGNVGPAFGPDGTLYVATGGGSGELVNAVVALDPATLTPKGWFTAASPFVSAPVVFATGGKQVVAAANADGRIYLLDAAAPGGADHKTALARSPQYATPAAGYDAGGLATFEDGAGGRWILAPSGGALAGDAKFGTANGAVSTGALVAFRVAGQGGTPSLEPGWVSRDLTAPATPLVMNGVVFALATGEAAGGASVPAARRAQQSKPAVLHALDAATGKEIWNSGTTITSFVPGIGPSGGDSQIYVVAHDGTVYAFGVPMIK